jgi:hypothetical protein
VPNGARGSGSDRDGACSWACWPHQAFSSQPGLQRPILDGPGNWYSWADFSPETAEAQGRHTRSLQTLGLSQNKRTLGEVTDGRLRCPDPPMSRTSCTPQALFEGEKTKKQVAGEVGAKNEDNGIFGRNSICLCRRKKTNRRDHECYTHDVVVMGPLNSTQERRARVGASLRGRPSRCFAGGCSN